MKKKEAAKLAIGLYRIHWKSGGSSLAAVGHLVDGEAWFAPTNWATNSINRIGWTEWKMVKAVEIIANQANET